MKYQYAIELMKQDRAILAGCLSDWDLQHYPEARRVREKKLAALDDAIMALEELQAKSKQKAFN